MKSKLVMYFENLLNNNLITYMEILDLKEKDLDIKIKVYFPKIVSNICTFFNEKFDLENKKNIVISRDQDGYHSVDIYFKLENKRVGVRLQSILKNTWGIDKNINTF